MSDGTRRQHELRLSPEIRKLIDDRVRSGRYGSAEDVIAAAITSLDQQDRLAQLPPPDESEPLFPRLREKIARGLADARAGKLSDGEAFFDELDQRQTSITATGLKD